MEDLSRRNKLGKAANKRPLQLISTDTWDISDELYSYSRIADLIKGSITIVEDRSDEAENKTRAHLQNIISDFWNTNKTNGNPWLQEFLRHSDPGIPRGLSQFKIDSKVGGF